MELKIKTDETKFFREYLKLMSFVPPFSKVTSRDLDVLAMLMRFSYRYRDIDESVRDVLVFDYERMVEIKDTLKMTDSSLNNAKMRLKKAGLIGKRKMVMGLSLFPDGNVARLEFTFTLNGKSADVR